MIVAPIVTRYCWVEDKGDGYYEVDVQHGLQRRVGESPRVTAMAKWLFKRLEEDGRMSTHDLTCDFIKTEGPISTFHLFRCSCDPCQCFGVGTCRNLDDDFNMEEI